MHHGYTIRTAVMPKLSDIRITDKTVKNAKPKDIAYDIRDATLRGFILKVQPTGSKAFYAEWGRGKRSRIGDAALITVTSSLCSWSMAAIRSSTQPSVTCSTSLSATRSVIRIARSGRTAAAWASRRATGSRHRRASPVARWPPGRALLQYGSTRRALSSEGARPLARGPTSCMAVRWRGP